MKRVITSAVLVFLLAALAALPALAELHTAPTARDDRLDALKGEDNEYAAGTLFANNGSGADDLGDPAATVASFGVANPTAASPGDSITLAGGTLTVEADGTLSLENPTETGLHVFLYRLGNTAGTSDASVTFDIKEVPVAEDDDYAFPYTVNQIVPGAAGFFADNGSGADNLGVPEASLISFGGGALGGGVGSNPPGTELDLAGGKLRVDANGAWRLLGAPFEPGLYRFSYRLANSSGGDSAQVSLSIQAAPSAANDSFQAFLNTGNFFKAGTLFEDNGTGADELGFPVAAIASFGGGSLGGSVTDNAPSSVVALAGGTLKVNANGSMVVAGATIPGTYTFIYRLQNSVASSDASVTLRVGDPPLAKDDAYSFSRTSNQSIAAGAGLFADNGGGADNLGTPAAVLFSYGSGSLGGGVQDNLAGLPVSLAGGTLIVNSDGSWSLSGAPFTHGVYTFQYRLRNSGGESDAQVTLNVQGPPVAKADDLLTQLGVNYSEAGVLFADNGSGADDRGTPQGTIASFGGGSLGGDVTGNAAGAAVAFAGGTLQVDGDGTLTTTGTTVPGLYTFDYRLTNSVAASDATVTLLVAEAPQAQDDAYDFLFDAAQNVSAAAGLFADNGNGADKQGTPPSPLLTFGGGSLGGTVADHAAGTSVSVAGGTLKVNADGSWQLGDAPFIPGIYTFSYFLQNQLDSSQAEVTLTIKAPPVAAEDEFTVVVGETLALPAGTLFADNGSGRDELGFPVAALASFGGGALGGSVTDEVPGTVVPFAGGTLRVDADGSLTITAPQELGVRRFDYRIENSLGSADATVSVVISEKPKIYGVWDPVIFR